MIQIGSLGLSQWVIGTWGFYLYCWPQLRHLLPICIFWTVREREKWICFWLWPGGRWVYRLWRQEKSSLGLRGLVTYIWNEMLSSKSTRNWNIAASKFQVDLHLNCTCPSSLAMIRGCWSICFSYLDYKEQQCWQHFRRVQNIQKLSEKRVKSWN